MDLERSFGEDKDKSENGKWFKIGDESKVRVAKLGNPSFKTEVVRLQKPYTSLLRSTIDTTKIIEKITIAAMAKTILLDWEGINLDGKKLDYSVENAETILTRFSDFKDVISEFSSERNNFLPKDLTGK